MLSPSRNALFALRERWRMPLDLSGCARTLRRGVCLADLGVVRGRRPSECAPPKLSTVYPRLRRTARRWLARGCEWERLTPCSSYKTRIIERLCLLA